MEITNKVAKILGLYEITDSFIKDKLEEGIKIDSKYKWKSKCGSEIFSNEYLEDIYLKIKSI